MCSYHGVLKIHFNDENLNLWMLLLQVYVNVHESNDGQLHQTTHLLHDGTHHAGSGGRTLSPRPTVWMTSMDDRKLGTPLTRGQRPKFYPEWIFAQMLVFTHKATDCLHNFLESSVILRQKCVGYVKKTVAGSITSGCLTLLFHLARLCRKRNSVPQHENASPTDVNVVKCAGGIDWLHWHL